MGSTLDKQNPDSRVSVVRYKGRYLFLIDGRGDAVFDKSWGIRSYATEELAQQAGQLYLRTGVTAPE